MKKYFAIMLAVVLTAVCFAGCGRADKKAALDEAQLRRIFANPEEEQEEIPESQTPSTVYLNSTRTGAVTKAANPVVGINFDILDHNYTIKKTRNNFQVDPIYGGGGPFYVMFDSPDEIVIGDFEYGFATAISTKWEDLIHIYDLENEVVYKVVTPLDTNRIKKVGDSKFAIQCGSAADGYRTYSFSTSDKYAYDLFENEDDVVMIVDGGHEYDVAKELAQESEGATTEPDASVQLMEEAEAAADTTSEQPAEAAEDTFSTVQTTGEGAEEQTASDDEAFSVMSDAEGSSDPAHSVSSSDLSASDETDALMESEQTSAASTEGSDGEEEIETTFVQTVNDQITEEPSEDQIYVAETEGQDASEEASLHTDIPGGRIINAPVIPQFPYYPSGCESVSTVMALQYHGVDITVDDFINRYLDMSNEFYIQDGLKYGPSPYQYFIGTPYDNSGFGCLAAVIYNALLKVYDYDMTKVVDASGETLDDLCLDYINHDLPVMVWANICMIESFDSNTWHLEDGSEYVWKAQEHCMLLVGYDQYNYYFNDPYTGQVLTYEKGLSEHCYEQQDMQAVVIME